jgi:hypothetical protein
MSRTTPNDLNRAIRHIFTDEIRSIIMEYPFDIDEPGTENTVVPKTIYRNGTLTRSTEVRQRVGLTPLMTAVYSNNVIAVRALLEKNANPNKPDYRGLCPLIAAIIRGHVGIVMLLVKQPDINLYATWDGRDAYDYADMLKVAHPLIFKLVTDAKFEQVMKGRFKSKSKKSKSKKSKSKKSKK